MCVHSRAWVVLSAWAATLLAAGCNDTTSVPAGLDPTQLVGRDLAIGNVFGCRLDGEGGVRCGGYGENGQLGRPTGGPGVPPEPGVLVDLGTDVVVEQVVATGFSVCVRTSTGRVKCWGYNEGRLGVGHTEPLGVDLSQMGDALPYIDLGSEFEATRLEAGLAHFCAVSTDPVQI